MKKQEGMASREISLRLEEGAGEERSGEELVISREDITLTFKNKFSLRRNMK